MLSDKDLMCLWKNVLYVATKYASEDTMSFETELSYRSNLNHGNR